MNIIELAAKEDSYIKEIMHHLRMTEYSVNIYCNTVKIIPFVDFKEILANLENVKKVLQKNDVYSTGTLEERLKYDRSAI